MVKKRYSDELQRALARTDADEMCRQIDAYAKHHELGAGEWSDNEADDFGAIITCHLDDVDKALGYVVIAADRIDSAAFLKYMGCGPLEDILDNPEEDFLERIVAEARKSARFRWMLNCPFKVAVSENAWEAIQKFRITGPHEEPDDDTFPSR